MKLPIERVAWKQASKEEFTDLSDAFTEGHLFRIPIRGERKRLDISLFFERAPADLIKSQIQPPKWLCVRVWPR